MHDMLFPNENFKEETEEIIEPPYLSSEIKIEIPDGPEETPEGIYEDKEDSKNVSLMPNDSTSHYENLNLYTCRYCQKSFKKNYHLKRHMLVHNDACTYQCPICDRGLRTEQSFKFHMSSHEGGKELFHCADCDFKSRKASSVKRHQIRYHAYIYGYSCHLCAKIFRKKTVFIKHMKVHTTVKEEMCKNKNQCDTTHECKNENSQNDESYHEQLQYEEKNQIDTKSHNEMDVYKPVKIDLQLYSDKNINELDRDLNLLKGKKYLKCPQCKWRFRTTKLLHKHLKRHLQSFKCDYCDAVFKYKASFLKHKYKHENER